MKEHWLYQISMITVATALLLLMYVAYHLIFPIEAVTILKDPLPISPKQLKPGEVLFIDFSFIKHVEVRPDIDWHIIGPVTYPLTQTAVKAPPGQQERSIAKEIPLETVPGTYFVQVDLSYKVFPLRPPLEYSWRSEKFEVIE